MFTIIILFILPCTSDDCVISVQIGTGKRNLFIAFTIVCFCRALRSGSALSLVACTFAVACTSPVAEVGYTAYVSVGYYYIFYVTECVRGYYCAGAF